MEAGRGPTATIIVQMGTLKVGDAFICGDYSGKVKSLIDDQGKQVKEAGPSTPVKVLGFSGLPNAGDELLVMSSEREAKTLSEERLEKKRTGKLVIPAARDFGNASRSSRRQEIAAHRAENRRAGLARSASECARPDREQEDRSRSDPWRRRSDLGERHPSGERVECRRRRFQRQGREPRRRRWPSARAFRSSFTRSSTS